MSRFVFWDGGLGGAAEAAVSTAVTLGLRIPQRLLLLNEGPTGRGLEEGIGQTVRLHSDTFGEGAVPEHGLDALLRLQSSGRLTASNLSDYTVPLLRGRLDLVCGTRLADSARKELDNEGIAEILAIAEQSYGCVILQAQNRRLSEVLQEQREGDVLVAVLPHRLGIMDEWFADVASYLGEPNRKLLFVISPFDPRSRWGLNNLKRRYSGVQRLIGIPYHTGFSDAWNARNILAYFRQTPIWSKRRGERELLLKGYYELGDMLMEMAAGTTSASISPKERGA
ncbi:hypothetical protein M3G15_05520 [Paenibacillus sp. p3-SID1389]|uniref:hypothetical protein n=1 Tax=Paenibacillus sp. p3-SID1389 TaxID=2916364 RepID=UPI0021A45611|nr:hypothetical protein [Paenibacillus sp. p3-SID1389]MCT2194602.1 hypothetical protein [Paenibacillus sp. p3-SID1389]